MNNIISANDLKTKGVSAIKKAAAHSDKIIITVRGKPEYVILPIKEYDHIREYQLSEALLEAKQDIKKSRVYKDSVPAHIKRISRD